MPRPLRPIAKGLIYHVICRGNNRQNVFFQQTDYEAFLRAIEDLQERKPFELYGYCLMTNHVHLLLKPQDHPISRLMQSLLVSHTQRYHKVRRSGGHVWQGRYKSPVVQDDDHLLTVLRYIEANPLRAKMVKRADAYPWSSYAAHGLGVDGDLLSIPAAYERLAAYPAVRQRKWVDAVHRDLPQHELAAVRRSVETGLPYGEPAWVQRLARRLHLDLAIRPRGRPRKALAE